MILDIIVVLAVAFGFFIGYQRGLIKTVFDTLSLVIGILAALKLSPIVIHYVDQILSVAPAISYLIGLVITFILVMGLIRLIGRQLEKLMTTININFINKIAGGLLQGFFFAFLLSMVLWLLGNFNILNQDIKSTSQTYPLLEPLPEFGKDVFTRLEPIFRDFWTTTTEFLDTVRDKAVEKQNR